MSVDAFPEPKFPRSPWIWHIWFSYKVGMVGNMMQEKRQFWYSALQIKFKKTMSVGDPSVDIWDWGRVKKWVIFSDVIVFQFWTCIVVTSYCAQVVTITGTMVPKLLYCCIWTSMQLQFQNIFLDLFVNLSICYNDYWNYSWPSILHKRLHKKCRPKVKASNWNLTPLVYIFVMQNI